MKKQFLFLAGFAAIFASCSREADITPEVKEPHHILIQASVAETRTSLTIDGTTGTYSWDENEIISVLEKDSSDPHDFQVVDRENGYFEGVATNDLVGAVSPALALGMYVHDGTDLEYMLSLSGDYAYADGTNAVMVAGAPTEEGSYQKFTFQHAAGLVMVTYENLPFGTKGLRFTTNKPIVGDWLFTSFDNVVLDEPSTGSNTAYVMFENAIGNEDLNKTFSFYIPVPVNEYTGIEIALVDDAKNDIAGTIKKMSSKQFSVALGGVVKFPKITLTPAEVQEAGYYRISSTADLESGQYLIVSEECNVAFHGGLDNLDKSGNSIVVSPSDGKIGITDATTAAEFTLAAITDGYSIKSASGKYIGRLSDTNGMDQDASTVYTNSISFAGNNADIVGSGNAHLRYNASTNNGDWFRYFKSATYTGQKAIQLYKRVAAGPVGGKQTIRIYFEDEGPHYVNSSEAESFVAPALVNPAGVPVTYSLVEENDYAEVDAQTGELTLVNGMPACEICVVAEFAGSSVYEPASASYSVFIVVPFDGIAELKEQIPSSGDYDFTLSLTDAVVTCVSGSRIFIQDSGAGIVLYGTEADLDEKDVINGIVTGTATIYQGQYEITDIDLSAANMTTQASVPCDDYSIADVLALGMDIESMRIKISYASVSAKSGKNITVKQDDGSTILCYDQNSVATSVSVGDLINVTGYYKLHNGTTDEIVLYTAADIETVTAPSITLSDVPSATVDVEGDVLSVGYSIANGITGKTVSASADVTWINTFDIGNDEIEFIVDSNDEGYSESRTGTVTVSYPYAAAQTFQVTQDGNSFAITYATVVGGTLSGPARAKAGDEVTLTATPTSDNYTFNDDWTVTPETPGISVTVTEGVFEMPAANVTVTGSFTKTGDQTQHITELVYSLFGTSYSTNESSFTLDDVSFGYINAMMNSSNGTPSGWAKNQVIQTKGSIYNKTSMGSISKIRIYIAVEGNSFSVLYGNDSSVDSGSITKPNTASGTETITYTKYENKTTSTATTTINYYDFDVEGASFFKFNTTKAVYIYKMEIYYEL